MELGLLFPVATKTRILCRGQGKTMMTSMVWETSSVLLRNLGKGAVRGGMMLPNLAEIAMVEVAL